MTRQIRSYPRVLALGCAFGIAILSAQQPGSPPRAFQRGGVEQVHEAPADAPSFGRVAPAAEPGDRLTVSGLVVGADGSPVSGASL